MLLTMKNWILEIQLLYWNKNLKYSFSLFDIFSKTWISVALFSTRVSSILTILSRSTPFVGLTCHHIWFLIWRACPAFLFLLHLYNAENHGSHIRVRRNNDSVTGVTWDITNINPWMCNPTPYDARKYARISTETVFQANNLGSLKEVFISWDHTIFHGRCRHQASH